jgi:hypothetical protein
MRKKITIRPKIRIKPKKKLDVKARERSEADKAFEAEAEKLRQKMAEKGFETKTRMKPSVAQVARWKRAREAGSS